jgi:hypothetical protein
MYGGAVLAGIPVSFLDQALTRDVIHRSLR